MNVPDAPFFFSIKKDDELCWYKVSKMGKNMLGSLAKDMSERARLEGRHTNHSARHTGINALSEYQDNEIIQITGHKNVEGLKPYKKLSMRQQENMSNTLTKYLCGENLIESDAADMIDSSNNTKAVEHRDINVEVIDLAATLPPRPVSGSASAYYNTNTTNFVSPRPMHFLSICVFHGNVTVHMHTQGEPLPKMKKNDG